VHFRFYRPYLNVLTKVDLLEDEDIENIASWSENWDRLYGALISGTPGMHRELNVELFRAMESMDVFKRLIPTSARMLYGYEDVYSEVQLAFGAGEDLEKR
jgi:hypothetical protein